LKVKHVAIIGLGSIGRRHLRLLKELRPELEVTLVRSGKGPDCPEAELATRTVHDINEAVQLGIHAAIISSPTSEHLKQAMILGKAGIHFLLEKPLSLSLAGVNELLEKTAKASIVSLTGYVMRYDPGAKMFKEMLDKKDIGKSLQVRVECGSYLPDWRPGQDYRNTVSALPELGGGVLLELSHELDYIRWFFGEFQSIQANLSNSGTLGINVEEAADLILLSQNGLPVILHLDFNQRFSKRFCSIQGTKGELILNFVSKQITFHPAGSEPQIQSYEYERDHIYREQLYHFLDCIENGTTPSVTLEDGAAALRIVDAARLSHQTGQRIELAS
jgi:predicted dehydrogenase